MFNKVIDSADEAINDIVDGSSIAVGGFGLVGVPNVLITALLRKGSKNLSIVSNNCGVDGGGLGILLEAGRIRHVTASYIGTNKEFERQYLSGLIELELTPQGTLAEKMRSGGSGIPAFYTPAGVGTLVETGQRAYIADTQGNCVFRKTAKNFNPVAAMAGKITIVEAEQIVPAGEIEPDCVHLPGIYVKRVIALSEEESALKGIEQYTVRSRG